MKLIVFLILIVHLHSDRSSANNLQYLSSNAEIEKLFVYDENEYSITSFERTYGDFHCKELQEDIVDCTIRVKSDDTDLKITFEDVSLFTCAKLKVGSWWNNTFN